MIDSTRYDRIPCPGFHRVRPINRLAERVRDYFLQHPEFDLETFLEAVRREIDFRQQRETTNGDESARREWEGTNRWSTARLTMSAEEIRMHAWLTERLAALHQEQRLWPKVRRLLFGNRLVRLLGLQPNFF
jgi:hypothetical protein